MQNTSVTPLPGYVAIKSKEPEKMKGGVYIPDRSQQNHEIGEVVAVGDPTYHYTNLIKCPVTIGDTVAFRKYADNEIEVGEEKLKMVKFEDLIAKLNIRTKVEAN